MIETLGARQIKYRNGRLIKKARFQVFIPGYGDSENQYRWGSDPGIDEMAVIGTFQKKPWSSNKTNRLIMKEKAAYGGTLFTADTPSLDPVITNINCW